MSPAIALIADDLTGAGDTAVQFLRAGWSTELRLAGGADVSADVLAVSTDSRALPAEEAARVVAEQTAALRAAGARHLYKKVDSTLRGPIRAEIDAALSAWAPGATAVVCPAFPPAGRTVRDGVLLVDGVPVARTGIGRDPVAPVRESHLPTLLDAAHVRLTGDDPAAGAKEITAAGPVVVADAETDEDLRRLAEAVARAGRGAVPVGSAGLAGPMAGAWAAQQDPAPALVVVTSLHHATRAQAEALALRRPDALLRPDPATLLDADAWARWSAAAHERLAAAEELLVLLAPEDRDARLAPELVARRFGALAADLAGAHRIAGLVVTGGDGARAVADALAATGIALAGEVAPGIPIGTLVGGPLHGRFLVTKAGGFGDTDVLIRAATAVRQRR
ncbi:uncharacterized protein YgbK (DUF1537 family) [Spinactinospora alkalitolerans]|uniref:Uncharacterized protein YgbK (DUF1537 family) n=1 Tax=Spinactinospora alkalitolerans TaxID=687207 RepID=A0A852TYX3_9ACTN|nr:four-carbon acid sugar kinase family protein [Spinactinospora alkalitolerans]NYE47010.1 uncharacterized protein YgbK (DUF1537 family) [Spinactinospora alkalitolerans]